MDMQAANDPRIIDAIWSITAMLDYTDKIAAVVTEELVDWRPGMPDGSYSFSVGEQLKHIADYRAYVAEMLSGEKAGYVRWAADYPGRDQPWQFREGSLTEILERLQFSRSLIQPWLEQGFSTLLMPTEGTTQSYTQQLSALREKGENTAALEAAGPGSLASAILFLVAHENGHRSVLQTLLRLAGAPVERLA
ncbi:MAG: DinB family protein [bacterium]